MAVAHPNACEGDSGVLIYKRVVCQNNRCEVFKVGACLHVGESSRQNGIFTFWNGIQGEKGTRSLQNATSIFAKKAEDLLRKYKTVDQLPGKYKCRTKATHKSQRGVSCAGRAQNSIMVA